jgi:hypothetical protein
VSQQLRADLAPPERLGPLESLRIPLQELSLNVCRDKGDSGLNQILIFILVLRSSSVGLNIVDARILRREEIHDQLYLQYLNSPCRQGWGNIDSTLLMNQRN